MKVVIQDGERIDDLQRNGLRIIQNPSKFCFGMDAVLLADFTRICPKDSVADMGTGTGILPVLLSQKQENAVFHAFELQSAMAEMTVRTVMLNGLEKRIHVYATDMRQSARILGYESMNAVVCNPPYGKRGGVLLSQSEDISLAKHEMQSDIVQIAAVCASVLINHGRASFVFPATRMLELCDALRGVRLQPKRMRMVCSKADKPPYLVLVEAVKNAHPGLMWLSPLIVYHLDGSETEELKRIYHRYEQ